MKKSIQEIRAEAELPLNLSQLPIRVTLDIPYCIDGNPAHTLDIALPAQGAGPFPAVVFIHGGGFYYGYKHNVHTAPAWNTIPAAGFALVSIDYRLTPEAPWPAQIYDCKEAILFLREHGSEYGLDPQRIGVWGNSAGGLLAAVLASTGDAPAYEDQSMGCPNQSSAVQAACVWYGIYDIPNLQHHWSRILKSGESPEQEDYDALGALINAPGHDRAAMAAFASAALHVHSEMPPMLLFHGTADHVVPYLQSVEFFERYLQKNNHSQIHLSLLEDAPHGGPAFTEPENLKLVSDFFRKWLIDSGKQPETQK